MAAKFFAVDVTSATRLAKRVAIVDASSVTRFAKRIFICDAGGTGRLVFLAFQPVTHTYDSVNGVINAIETVPANATLCAITVRGGGANGWVTGFGGGGGGYITVNVPVIGGQTFTVTQGQALGATTSGLNGFGSTVIWGPSNQYELVAFGGNGATSSAVGTGGTSSFTLLPPGNTGLTQIAGGNGTAGNPGHGGVGGGPGGGAAATGVGQNGNNPGGGAASGAGGSTVSGAGAQGEVTFFYTG